MRIKATKTSPDTQVSGLALACVLGIRMEVYPSSNRYIRQKPQRNASSKKHIITLTNSDKGQSSFVSYYCGFITISAITCSTLTACVRHSTQTKSTNNVHFLLCPPPELRARCALSGAHILRLALEYAAVARRAPAWYAVREVIPCALAELYVKSGASWG